MNIIVDFLIVGYYFILYISYGFYYLYGIRLMINDLIIGVGDNFMLKLIMC